MTLPAAKEGRRIRLMTTDDVEAVMALAASLETAPQWPRFAYEAAVDLSVLPPRVALVAELDGQIIGFAIASFIPPEAELETIAVLPRRQRKGAGSDLLAELCRELASREVREISLEVRASNVAAREFYRTHSFREFADRPAYYSNTGESAILARAHIPILSKRK
jgi:ribosomal-protein-alanine N-acetyltransferase